jgi:hypothetical protein
MNKFLSKILLVASFVFFNVNSVIIESDSFAAINEHVSPGVIVVTDLDHTVIENKVDLDTWIPLNINDLKEKGLSIDDAVFYSLSLYYNLQNFVGANSIDGSEKIINLLQNKNIPVVGLTNRSRPILDKTVSQLSNLGINFNKTSLYKDDLDIALNFVGKYSNGIIFCGSNDKGGMLFKFFDLINYKPKKIIFIDDKLKYVESVEKASNERDIEYVGIRYSFQDSKKDLSDNGKKELKKEIENLKVDIGMESLDKKKSIPLSYRKK